MELRRQPYLLKFKKDNEAAVAKKIRELQMAAEQPRNQVASLQLQDAPQPPLHEPAAPQPPVPTASARTIKLPTNQTTPTARKPQKCQDYLQTQNSINLQEERPAQRPAKPPLPVIKIPGDEEQDKRLEYLVSDEYNKYLEKLQGGGKVEQAKALKEKFNNNIYLGKKDRKQYIHDIIKTKEVLPRVNLQFLREQPITKTQREFSRGRGQLADSYMYNEREIRELKSIRQAEQRRRREIEQESPIKWVNRQFDTGNKKDYISDNVTIMLSPVCQKQQKQLAPKQKQAAAKQKQTKEIAIFFHNHYKGIDMFKPNSSPYQSKPQTPRAKTFKHETFRKQLEHCQKEKHVSDKEPKEQYKQKKSSCRGNKNKQNKQNYEKKIPPTPSPSSSQSSSQSPQNIYDISFKIDMPRFTKKQYTPQPQISKKHTIIGQLTQYPNYNMQAPPQNCPIYKHTYYPQKPRIFTEHTYNPYPLEYSQASSTTRTSHQGQPRNSHSPHKMSVISRSKHRR